jgi:hypothetical protein
LAVVVLLIQEADKLTLGQHITLQVPYQVTSLLNGTVSQWISLTTYQALLGENPWVRVKAVRILSPAMYLPEEEGEPLHSCKEILDEVFSSWPNLTDTAIPNADLELFTDGSQSLQEGGYWTRYAVTTVTQVVERGRLLDHWSAQRTELYNLTRALTISDGKTANIYTDWCYAFATLHIHGAIYKERGLLTSGGKEIKNSQHILQLLEAVWKLRAIVVIVCLSGGLERSPLQYSEAVFKPLQHE